MVRVADRIICPSPSLAKELSYYFADSRKIHVIPNGIDLTRFDRIAASGTELLEKWPIEKEHFILYVGRLDPVKGVEYLIEAFKSIRKKFPKLKLVIAGRGNYESYLKSSACDLKDVFFVGFVSLQAQKFLYENSLAVVVPSLHETFPFVPLEAMACSKPVVASNVGGVRLMVRHGKNGFLTRPRNSRDLAKFIMLLCQTPDLSRKMGISGREIVEKEFTVGKMVSETLGIYKLLS
jgi:glycosyltransferase involved in cell wall biosynthesis